MAKNKENKIIKYTKEHKILVSLILLIVVLIIVGISLAIFITEGEGTEKSYGLGNINVKYKDGDELIAKNAIPLADYEIEEYATQKEFSFENTGNITMYAEILLTDIAIDNSLISNDFRWILYEKDINDTYNEVNNGSFIGVKNDSLSIKKGIRVDVEDSPKNYKILVYIRDNNGVDQNDMMNKSMSAKITVKATSKPTLYEDDSGANPPKLTDGMIPVVYDEDNDVWVKADINDKWYDYDDFMWANAVTVYPDASNCSETDTCVDSFDKKSRTEYMNAEAGTKISMDDINSMWVWIPRYKYRIPNSIGSIVNVLNPPEIDIVFETGLQATGVTEKEYRNSITSDGKVANGIYYTHPAFRNINNIYYGTEVDSETRSKGGWDHELTGIWVGKFETTGTKDHPTIKPNEKILRNLLLGDQFKTSLLYAGGQMNEETGDITFSGNIEYGLNSDANSHMIKNTEYGAMVILSQSKYGKMGNINFDKDNKEIFRNNTYSSSSYTGISAGCGKGTSYNKYSYDDHICLTGEIANCTGKKVKGSGVGASTTGTIYGIYDLNGGNWERVMANWNNMNDSSSLLPVLPQKKYYDVYTGDGDGLINKDESILGDATWETNRWYSDCYGNSRADSAYWLLRSSASDIDTNGGAFTVQFFPNSYAHIISYRNSLIIEK